MYDINKVRSTTKIKLIFMSISIVLPIVLYFILDPLLEDYWQVGLDVEIVRIIILVALEAFVIWKEVFYIRILKSDDYALKIMTKKNDERLIFIRQKYSTYSLKQFAFLLCIAIIVTGFINKIVFYSLVITLVVLIITVFITTLYYKKKY